ncbi:GNAT family N-acetyltransferase [Robinsoniella peoriensis]|uniref:GNAT family N-acetyltransferase n=1 Tax=Robinsoniella peoriensis TaxID=180332 RepID=UPI0009DFDD23
MRLRITVNSSPFAIPVYHKFGFVDTDTEKVTNGLMYTPMEISLLEVRGSAQEREECL